MDRLLNPHQLAEFLNVRPGTVYSWLSRKVDLPASVKIGGSTRWREEVVKKWIEAKEKERKSRNFEI
jgi:predicted DNA-binding transcriptional regulator AlpA